MSTHLLVENLLSSEVYDHPTPHLRLIETHISWVILTGEYAYKIKKPVNFEFLDFSTLEKRKYYCEEELRLGCQFAPEIYLAVVPIMGTSGHPQVNGTGPILEYALKMKEFAQENLLSVLLKQGRLTETIIEQLATLIAESHKKTHVAPKHSHFGLAKEVHAPTKQNFEQIAHLLSDIADTHRLKCLESWADQQYEQHHALFTERKKRGFIRDCHGDLHLANIILYKNKPMLFDRLEFNEDLRWTDVIADLAFLIMDLTEKKQLGLANLLLNAYLHNTGDYQGLALLPYYLAYRAVVRAKIALFRLKQELNNKEKKEIQHDYHNFITLAEIYTRSLKPSLIITHGFAGSGKTTIARNFVKHCGAIHINSDIIRKRLFHIPLDTRSNSGLNSGIYTAQATKETYEKLIQLAELIIKTGFTVVVDATFLKQAQRALFYKLSMQLHVPFYILHCQANDSEIEKRIKNRLSSATSVSEADLTILNDQKEHSEPLTNLEKNHTLVISAKQTSLKSVLKKICPESDFGCQ
jgi:aminoglycoside phosphotransferase family enzyme/predicted kinase